MKAVDCRKDSDQLIRVSLQLDAHEIRHAVGAHRPWKATASEPWLMVPAVDFSRYMLPLGGRRPHPRFAA
jgi:hypothetical protein